MSSEASSKHRKSRRKSASKNKSFTETSVANDGIDFLALLLGLIAGATLILLAVGVIKKPTINPDILSADETKIGDVAAAVKGNDFKTFVNNADTEKLAETLDGLNSKRVAAGSAGSSNILQRRILVADQLMTRKLTEKQRRLAATSKIRTLATMFWSNRNKATPGGADLEVPLREAVNKFSNDSDASISRIARLEKAGLNSLTADQDVNEHARELYGLLKDFPADKRVTDAVFKCLSRQIAANERIPTATKIVEFILRQPKITASDANTSTSAWARISDLWQLCDRGFFELFSRREIIGPPGLEQLTKVCTDLLELPIIGEEAAGQIQITALWLEQNDHYDLASKIYSRCVELGPAVIDKRIGDMVVLNGQNGTKRCNAIGKPFSLQATTLNNQQIAPTAFEGLPVLIILWSSHRGNTQRLLSEVEKASRRWRRGAVKIIAVQAEKEKKRYGSKLAKSLAEQHPKWDFCGLGPDGSNPIFQQIPSKKPFRLMLLDRDHRLLDVDIEILELPTIVNSALATRR